MRPLWMGVTTAALIWGSAGSALANQQAKEQKASSEGQKTGQAVTQGQHELTAEIAAIKGETLYLRKNNAIIPLKVERSTEVDGRPLMKSQSISQQLKNDFREGEEVRTSFNVQDTTNNIAASVSKVGAQHRGTKSEKPSQPEKSTNPSMKK